LPSVRALITIPRAVKDLLIFFASSRVCPDAPVLLTFINEEKGEERRKGRRKAEMRREKKKPKRKRVICQNQQWEQTK